MRGNGKRAIVFGAVVVSGFAMLVACSGGDDATTASPDAGADVVVPIGDASHDVVDAADAAVDARPADASVPDASDASVDAGPCVGESCPAGYYCLGASDVYNTGDSDKNFAPKCVPLPAGCTTCGCAVKDGNQRTHLGCACIDDEGDSGGGPLLPDDAGQPFLIGCSEA